jgi:hypothetical protein
MSARAAGRRVSPVLLVGALIASLLVLTPVSAEATLCPDVPHSPDPVELACASQNERWAVVDVTSGLVTNVVGWNGTNLWRPPAGQIAIDLPDGASAGPGWWFVDGTFVQDSFERNVTARAGILSVHLSWSTGGLGTDSMGVTYTVDVRPTGQQFTVNDSSIRIDPLEAGVEHTFTVTATRPDGTVVQGPIVAATPQPDPDPDCTDTRVARECRKATNWAAVHPDTRIVGNVIVCTKEQCGPDGPWGGVSPADTPTPGHLLIELTGPGGIGWKYVDGTFVDVRPREEPFAVTPIAPSAPSNGAEPRTGDDDTTDDDTTDTATRLPGDVTGIDQDDAGDTNATWLGDGIDDGIDDEDVGARDVDTEPADASAPEGSSVSAGSNTAGVPAASSPESRESGTVRRVIEAVVTFFTSLFRR